MSAVCGVGLDGFNISNSKFGTQLVLMITIHFESSCLLSLLPLILKRRYIRKHFNHPVVRQTIELEDASPTSKKENELKQESFVQFSKEQIKRIPPLPIFTIQLPTQREGAVSKRRSDENITSAHTIPMHPSPLSASCSLASLPPRPQKAKRAEGKLPKASAISSFNEHPVRLPSVAYTLYNPRSAAYF
ncbi:uncharacterized protein MONOS_5452 [Monocercomonoides exilis]|uniref:uncharacterized protein n=1 Tax=Monocercomonoides exilis TaxID=2049356 RepID=UPI00355AA49D|nr:hypothetical protein MONOS_5452 [Monocercomonoides exilis]|eukprot:MONOS_5452.1-p1 / transcript=MONOS_5452.1 / gene=MONOS_5452 / organism=Monocercomonoides_exilis_PA203 / gene_product=unspecified product / transcript_product=unspecified product / location=Mono_scaffold00158:91956-92522(+) / protein_length=189 / sequence_SO=supercontig / SO=protein_coding / is_pseudo=false